MRPSLCDPQPVAFLRPLRVGPSFRKQQPTGPRHVRSAGRGRQRLRSADGLSPEDPDCFHGAGPIWGSGHPEALAALQFVAHPENRASQPAPGGCLRAAGNWAPIPARRPAAGGQSLAIADLRGVLGWASRASHRPLNSPSLLFMERCLLSPNPPGWYRSVPADYNDARKEPA